MQLITSILIALGALVILISIISVSKLLKILGKQKYSENWKILRYFISAFFLAYMLTIYLVFVASNIIFFLTGVVFFLGALFVLAVTAVGRKTIEDLIDTSVSRSYLNNIIHSMADTLIVIDTDQFATIKNVNNAALRLLRYKEQELVNKSINMVLDEKSINKIDIEELKKGKFILEKEITYKNKTGKEIPILFSASPLLNIHNDVEGIIFVGQDITFKKQTEQEINSYLEQLKVSEAKLKELNNTKDKFFSIIAHDLLNPLSALTGYSAILSSDTKELSIDEIEDFSKTIHTLAKNIFDLLENLLMWSRIQTGKMAFEPRIFDFTSVYAKVFDLYEQVSINKGIFLTNELVDNNFIFADFNMIYTIIRNLVSNSLKFTPKGGEINITTKFNENYLEVSVNDNGVGIPIDVQQKLFRIDLSVSTLGTDQEKGTGLGLILCKELVERNGGVISIESQPNKGCKIIFTVPRNSDLVVGNSL